MSKILNLVEAVSSFILSLEQSVITDYQIGLFIYQSYLSKRYRDHDLRLSKSQPEKEDYNRLIKKVIGKNIISPRKEFSDTVFNIQNKPLASIEEVVCAIDPFAYISHLGAMGYYGLSASPKGKIFLSSYPLSEWRKRASVVMAKDCGSEEKSSVYKATGLPRLRKINISRIPGFEVVGYNDKNISSFSKAKRKRIASVERIFLDMLRRPDLCGGIESVIQAYKNHVARYLEPVLKEIDNSGSQVEKVRAGYLLEEVCGIKDFVIESWLQFVQRGGSRKLDPFSDFSPEYSERWCLSLNI
jgi:hypothetical protein